MTGASAMQPSVKAFIGVCAVAVLATLAGAMPAAVDEISARPLAFAGFAALTCGLQLMAVRVFSRGTIGVAGIGMLATGFAFGVGPAMLAALAAIAVNTLRRRTPLHRAAFNASGTALAAAAGAGLYHAMLPSSPGAAPELAAAAVAGVAFCIVNLGLLTLVMSFDEKTSAVAIWRERFAWVTPYYLAFGVFAFAAALAYEDIAFAAVIAAVVPPALGVLRVSTSRRLRTAP